MVCSLNDVSRVFVSTWRDRLRRNHTVSTLLGDASWRFRGRGVLDISAPPRAKTVRMPYPRGGQGVVSGIAGSVETPPLKRNKTCLLFRRVALHTSFFDVV